MNNIRMIEADDINSFTKKVNELLNNGYKLYGNPIGQNNKFYQMMIVNKNTTYNERETK